MALRPSQPRPGQGVPRQPPMAPQPRPPSRPRPGTPRPGQGVPRQPPRNPGPRPVMRPSSDNRPEKPRARPKIDKRQNPGVGWSIGRWFRRSPLAIGLAALLENRAESDDGIGRLSPAFVNNVASPEWPVEIAEPIEKRGQLVGLVLHPVDWPVIAPVPIEYPDDLPFVQPVPMPRPMPRPERLPIEPVPGVRPSAPGRPKPQAEVTIVIEVVPGMRPSSEPSVRVRAVQRFKYQIYASQRRKMDAKGVYLRLQEMITVTFGTLTEVQDFVEAAAWNIVDAKGRPVMTLNRGDALDATEGIENGLVRGVVVNFRQYAAAFAGLVDGRYSLDLGGFAFDYAMSQASDMEAAFMSRKVERMARALGLDSMMGVEGMLGMHRRLAGMSRQERASYVREIQKQWDATFARRVYWSRAGLSSRPGA